MHKVVYRADLCGITDCGGLRSFHSFSFNDYHNAERLSFGALCVLNDDCFAPESGVGFHAHDNVEMLWFVLEGELTHRDDLGSQTTLRAGEAQLLSAGSGVWHSERNDSTHQTRALQIWLQPDTPNTPPRYEKRALAFECNAWQSVAAPFDTPVAGALAIRQNAWVSLANLNASAMLDYEVKRAENGIYVFVAAGEIEIAGEVLEQRDAIGLTGCSSFEINSRSKGNALLVEVEMPT